MTFWVQARRNCSMVDSEALHVGAVTGLLVQYYTMDYKGCFVGDCQ